MTSRRNRHQVEDEALGARLRTQTNVMAYWEPRLMRYVLLWETLLVLPGIPVAAAHGVPLIVAILAQGAVSLTCLVLALRWNRRPRVAVIMLLAIAASFWPTLVWTAWALFVGLFAILPVGVWLIAIYLRHWATNADAEDDRLEAEQRTARAQRLAIPSPDPAEPRAERAALRHQARRERRSR